jgi:spermidine synthase
MPPQHLLGREHTPDGAEVVLYQRVGVFTIRVNGLELMTSRARGSEKALARLVLSRVQVPRPRVLVGGLGLGYTLRAVLDQRPPVSRVTVVELLSAVIQWNRRELAHLAGSPLEDPRVELVEGDVAAVIDSIRDPVDAILLDVDNGPSALTVTGNNRLYSPTGLRAIRHVLCPGGVLGVWSADPAPEFLPTLCAAGFVASAETVHAQPGVSGVEHTIFVAERMGGG